MHSLRKQPPSIDDFVISGVPSQRRREARLVRLLGTTFSGSLTPLLLLTRESLPDITGFGPHTMQLISQRLEAKGLRLRLYEESAEKRAINLHGDLTKVPIQALYVFAVSYEPYQFAHYAPSRVLPLLCELDPSMTLGELTEMSRGDLCQYLKMKEISIDARRFNQLVYELRSRLKAWGLKLRTERREHIASMGR